MSIYPNSGLGGGTYAVNNPLGVQLPPALIQPGEADTILRCNENKTVEWGKAETVHIKPSTTGSTVLQTNSAATATEWALVGTANITPGANSTTLQTTSAGDVVWAPTGTETLGTANQVFRMDSSGSPLAANFGSILVGNDSITPSGTNNQVLATASNTVNGNTTWSAVFPTMMAPTISFGGAAAAIGSTLGVFDNGTTTEVRFLGGGNFQSYESTSFVSVTPAGGSFSAMTVVPGYTITVPAGTYLLRGDFTFFNNGANESFNVGIGWSLTSGGAVIGNTFLATGTGIVTGNVYCCASPSTVQTFATTQQLFISLSSLGTDAIRVWGNITATPIGYSS